MNLVHNTTSLPGYWGKRTSSINWCEPDYIHSYYVAELFNTFSNLFYIFWAYYSSTLLTDLYLKARVRPQRKMYICCLGLAGVGIGSFLFHCCLTQLTQAIDEIAMNVGILTLGHCALTLNDYKRTSEERLSMQKMKPGWRFTLRSAVTRIRNRIGFLDWYSVLSVASLTCVLALLLYCYDNENPALFQSLFASCFLGVVALSVRRAHWHSNQYINSQNTAKNIEEVKHHMRMKKVLLYYMIGVVVVGYSSWIIDNLTCPRLEMFKLHSIWHFMTSYACYLLGMFLIYTYYSDKHDDWCFETCKPQKDQAPWVNPNEVPFKLIISWNLYCIPTVALSSIEMAKPAVGDPKYHTD